MTEGGTEPMNGGFAGRFGRRWMAVAAALVFLAVFAVLAGHGSIWFDELFSFSQSRLSFGKLLDVAVRDIHPPGYPLLLKLFMRLFGDSWYAARMFSVLAVFGAGVLLALSVRERRAGAIAAVFFFCLPAVGFCAVAIRMYALTMFFLAAFICCACRLAEGEGRWPFYLGLGISAWYGVLTLNYAALYLAAAALWLLFRLWSAGRRRDFCFTLAVLFAAFLAYLPWLGSAWGQLTRVRAEFWAPPLTLKATVLILDTPFMGYSLKFFFTLIPAGMALLLLGVGEIGAFRNRDAEHLRRLWWLVAVTLFPALFGVTWSLLRGQTLIIDRMMLPACVPLALALGEAYAAPYVRRGVKVAALIVFTVFFVFHVGCTVYRTTDGVLTELQSVLRSDYAQDALWCGDPHAAADLAGLLPERRVVLLSDEADPMGISVLGNVDVTGMASSFAGDGKWVVILGDEMPEEFRRRAPGMPPLQPERHFYSRYRFQHFNICRAAETPSASAGR
jgi:hypothetical protein